MIQKKLRILVVDDQISWTLYVRETLEEEGYEVIETNDARMCLRLFKEYGPFDLVMLDIKMPEINGITLMRNILEIDSYTPVLLCSGYTELSESFDSWAADAFFIKTSESSELIAAVKKILGEK